MKKKLNADEARQKSNQGLTDFYTCSTKAAFIALTYREIYQTASAHGHSTLVEFNTKTATFIEDVFYQLKNDGYKVKVNDDCLEVSWSK